jgi:hypothetical protein
MADARNAMRLAIASCLLLFLAVGCKNVWIHPEATREKYNHDLYLCQFGTKPPNVESLGDPDRANPTLRRDWKHCMASLGWEIDNRSRSSKPYARR